MDKLTKYKQIVQKVIHEIAQMTPSDDFSETQIIIDDERGHYLLFSVGWSEKRREYAPFVHIDVLPNNKVYLQHDGTDLKIALWLSDKGISKQDIVLAFHAPHHRAFIPEFAID
ncbi:MAG: XisI protein [Spirosomaceae bacterium]|jgi:hypothetical protein|nr:XisI protein [Spirosomataceae bacterium]